MRLRHLIPTRALTTKLCRKLQPTSNVQDFTQQRVTPKGSFHLKVRIFALAKELGLANKALIDLCNDAGLQIKNSALASITEEERDIVVNFMKGRGAPAEENAPVEPAVPTRDSAQLDRKIRAIQSRPVVEETRVEETRVEETKVEETIVEEAVAEPEETVVQADTPDEDSGSDETQTEPTKETEATPAVAESSEIKTTPTKSETEADSAPAIAKPVSRDDFTPAGANRRPVREMRPIGSVRESDARKKPQQKKAALPNIAAAPSYKPPVTRAEKRDEPAQKPDMALTPEILEKQSPLADRLRTKRDDGNAAPRRTGGLIEKRRRERQSMTQQQQQRGGGRRQTRSRRRRTGPIEFKSEATVQVPITVRSLSEAMGRPAKSILSELFKKGTLTNINAMIDEDAAEEIALELGVELTIKRERDMEDVLAAKLEPDTDDANVVTRPPIVTILGHVDHGKTTLVDRIRSSNVVEGEAGGITQHIAAYQVVHDGNPITFVDTPGHAAFGEMRARGANVTDIIVLVVAADDGIMPQTIESISHAKASGVPIVVAMNKCDLPDIDEQRVLQGLAGQDLLPAEWGGDVEVVRISALKGTGIENLLETIFLTAELQDYKANADSDAVGVCLESFRDEGRGALAWLMVQKGTLRVGDVVLCGQTYGRIRAMYNDRDEELSEAPPSMPVKVAGLEAVPDAGSHFFVMDDIDEARTIAADREHEGRSAFLATRNKPQTMEDILAAAGGNEIQELPLIVKADTPGSIEALRGEIHKFEHPEVRVSIVHEGVGGVNESDVYLASTTGAIIVAFHVIADDKARAIADNEGVEIRRYSIIYKIADDIKTSIEGLLKPEEVTVTTGRALVLKTFSTSRFGTIAGCRVLSGTIARDNRMLVIRDQNVLNDYRISSLKREKDDAKEVRDGMECGIRLDGFNDVKEGDLLEAFRIDKVQRTLD
jgi:translation initiation factor IF-2